MSSRTAVEATEEFPDHANARARKGNGATRGRPTKLTDDLSGRLLAAIEAGMSYRRACLAVGIHYSTLLEWQSKGTGETARQPYKGFAEELEGAEARGELECLRRIRNGGPGDWRGPAWLLERRYPERWGRRAPVELHHSTPDGPLTVEVKHEIDFSRVSDEDLEALGTLLDRVLGDVGEGEDDPLPLPGGEGEGRMTLDAMIGEGIRDKSITGTEALVYTPRMGANGGRVQMTGR